MIGVDYKIDVLKTVFQNDLFSVIGHTYVSYGRAFVNDKKTTNKLPEIYLAENKYKDMLLNTSIDGHSFFIVESTVEPLAGSYVDMIANVGIYFLVNLTKLYPSVTERAVEYLHKDVLGLLSDSEFEFVSYVQGMEAFTEFAWVKMSDNMQPNYLVKFNTKVEFQINENINC